MVIICVVSYLLLESDHFVSLGCHQSLVEVAVRYRASGIEIVAVRLLHLQGVLEATWRDRDGC